MKQRRRALRKSWHMQQNIACLTQWASQCKERQWPLQTWIFGTMNNLRSLSHYHITEVQMKYRIQLVFESPVPRLGKDWDWTGPRPEKTGPAVQVFDFWESKTGKRPVFMNRSLRLRPVWTGESVPLIKPSKMSPRSPETVKIWPRNKLNCTMLTKIVDFAEYYCRNFNS